MKSNKFVIGSASLVVLFFLLKIHIPVIEIIVDEKTYFVRDTSFTLSWIHSVEKEPWYEIYKRKNSHLILTETYFKTFGAGVPSNKEIIKKNNSFINIKVKRKIEKIKNSIIKKKINRKIDKLNIIVSEDVQTTLIIGDKKIELYKLLENYSEVTIQVKNLHLWNIFRGDFLWTETDSAQLHNPI